MMGPRQDAQGALFYEFSIEGHVPQDHLLLSVDRFVELSGTCTVRPNQPIGDQEFRACIKMIFKRNVCGLNRSFFGTSIASA